MWVACVNTLFVKRSKYVIAFAPALAKMFPQDGGFRKHGGQFRRMNLKGDQATSRAINLRMLLNILQNGPCSRRDLSVQTRLSPGSVTALVQDLIAAGLVEERDAGKSSGGRRPIPVAIRPDARWSIGIKLSETGLGGVLTDLAATTLASASRTLSAPKIADIIDQIAGIVGELVPDNRDRANRLIGVGIAIPGFVDVVRGSVSSEHRILRADVPLAALVSDQIGVPVWIDNDVNAYTIAHRRFGLARGKDTVLAIVLGMGVGAGLVVHGKIHRGAHNRAGEIGFSPSIAAHGPGRTIGADFTLTRIEERWTALGRPFEGILQAVGQADKGTGAFLRALGHEIGLHIALLAQMIDPDAVVIGGETLQLGPDYIDAIRETLEANLLNPHGTIVFDVPNHLWEQGAAVLAIDHFFDFENVAGHRSINPSL
jgi:predicted NBD/HSP70 family sugar kinase